VESGQNGHLVMSTGRVEQLPTNAVRILSQRDFHLFAANPPETWPPTHDLEVFGGPLPDGQPHVWVRTTVGAAMNHRPGSWKIATGYTPPLASDGSAPTSMLPHDAREIGRIGSGSLRLYTILPIGIEPSNDDIVYVAGRDGSVTTMPLAIASKFGRWMPVDASARDRVATRSPQAIPARARRR